MQIKSMVERFRQTIDETETMVSNYSSKRRSKYAQKQQRKTTRKTFFGFGR